jgi:hypothetical protein
MYYVYDYYEGKQLVGKFDGWLEMKEFMKEYRLDTDGECELEVEFRENPNSTPRTIRKL